MRHHSRQRFPSQIQINVSNPRNGELIGHLRDVSETGIKIVSDLPFVRDENLRVKIHADGIEQHALNAVCKWSDSREDQQFAGGFYLEQPPAEFIAMVEALRGWDREEGRKMPDVGRSADAKLSA